MRGVVALAVVVVAVTLLNPRGVGQHLTFFTSSTESAVWAISEIEESDGWNRA